MTTFDRSIHTERRLVSDRRAGVKPHTATAIDWIAMVVLIIGGVNWGLVGLMNIDLVAVLFGEMTAAARAVYAAVGLSGLYAIYMMMRMSGNPNKRVSQ